jgi:glycosyltransferase involved in cell wall biosynthesis
MAQIGRPVMIDWQLSSYFGWGIYGINLMLNWIQQQPHPLLTNLRVRQSDLKLNPIEWAKLQPGLEPSWEWNAKMAGLRGRVVTLDIPVLHAMGNDFGVAASGAHGIYLSGTPSLGVTFFESTHFSPESRERAKAYPLIVAGSTWNLQLLRAAEVPCTLVLQGADPTKFHPAPRAGWFAGRFAIFSGGKLEYRKGQDIVLKAFRIFAQRHADAVLVTAWESPWPEGARGLGTSIGLAPVCFHSDGRIDAAGWAAANGIPADQFIDLGAQPNSEMARLYREMDVALFANRAEGGTNLVAMECMACGIPVILSANTGHLDLIAPDRCFPLTHQSPTSAPDQEGWGESDIDEIVEALETVCNHQAEALARAKQGSAFMSKLTWAETARQMADVISPYVAGSAFPS